MNLIEALSLFTLMLALAALPSTSVALVVTRSATAGLANGVAVAAGIVLGDLVFVLLAILGMAAVAEYLGGLFLVLRYLGGAYLIWLGLSLWRAQPPAAFGLSRHPASGLSTSFLAGFILTLGDVKAIFFYASLLPAFVDLAAVSATDIALIVAITMLTVGGVKVAYAYGARQLVGLAGGLRRGPGWARRTVGGFMVGAGAYLIAKS